MATNVVIKSLALLLTAIGKYIGLANELFTLAGLLTSHTLQLNGISPFISKDFTVMYEGFTVNHKFRILHEFNNGKRQITSCLFVHIKSV